MSKEQVHIKKPKELTLEAMAARYIAEMARPFAMIAGAVLLLGVGYYGYRYYATSLETKSQEELFTIQKSVDDKIKNIEKDSEEASGEKAEAKGAKKDPKVLAKKEVKKPEAKKPKVEVEKTPQSLAAKFSEDLTNYDHFIQSHANKKASYMAAIQAAKLSADYKDYDRAEKILRAVVNTPDRSDLFAGLLRAQLSTVLIDEKKCGDAISELTKITENPAQSYFHPHAFLRMGACYIETKDWEKAQTALTRVEKDFANTQAASDAKQLKRLLILKKSQTTEAKS